MAADMGHELRKHKVTVVSLWPGAVQTELVTKLIAEEKLDMKSMEVPKVSLKIKVIFSLQRNVSATM